MEVHACGAAAEWNRCVRRWRCSTCNVVMSTGTCSANRRAAPRSAAKANSPSVSVLAPCRGVEASLWPMYGRSCPSSMPAMKSCSLSNRPPTLPGLCSIGILTNTPGARASLIITGTAEGCSQKIHNLLVGLEHIAPETSILAFVDSDVQVHPHWLRRWWRRSTTRGGGDLGLSLVCAVSGSVAGSLRSAWNAATLSLIAHRRYGCAWGGSTAMRREVFEKLRIRDAWSCGLSDDLLLTQAVRAAGLKIPFVRSLSGAHLRALHLAATARMDQPTNCHCTGVCAVCLGSLALLVHLRASPWACLGRGGCPRRSVGCGGLLLSYWVINGLGSLVVCRGARQRLSAHGFTVAQRAWAQALWTPAVTCWRWSTSPCR